MIQRSDIRKEAEEQNIPFRNLLTAVVSEAIIEILANSRYKEELFISNSAAFNIDYYKDFAVDTIYYEYMQELDKAREVLYLRDILKQIISDATTEALIVNGSVEDNIIKLSVTVDEMYVPIRLVFSSYNKNAGDPIEEIMYLSIYECRSIKYYSCPKEELLAKNVIEIVEKLELINNMDCYYDVYDILTKYPINGRKVKDRLAELLEEKNIKPDQNRFDLLKSYGDYTYMKKKWKVELRQKKTSEPTWQDVNNCLINFLTPIWDAIERNIVYLGDWMPQLKRFLD